MIGTNSETFDWFPMARRALPLGLAYFLTEFCPDHAEKNNRNRVATLRFDRSIRTTQNNICPKKSSSPYFPTVNGKIRYLHHRLHHLGRLPSLVRLKHALKRSHHPSATGLPTWKASMRWFRCLAQLTDCSLWRTDRSKPVKTLTNARPILDVHPLLNVLAQLKEELEQLHEPIT